MHGLEIVVDLKLSNKILEMIDINAFEMVTSYKEWSKKKQFISILVHFLEIFVWKFSPKAE